MSIDAIGTCSICGGPVVASIGDEDTCKRCGAVRKQDFGPVIPMEPRRDGPQLVPLLVPYRPYETHETTPPYIWWVGDSTGNPPVSRQVITSDRTYGFGTSDIVVNLPLSDSTSIAEEAVRRHRP